MNRKVVQVVLCTLSFVVIDAGGPTVRTEIPNGVVQTGIGQYGTYLLPNSLNFVNVSCTTSVLPQDAEIILLVNDTELGRVSIEAISPGATSRAVFTFRITSTGITQLTCRLQIATTLNQNQGSFVYVADDSVELNVWPVPSRPRCVSSIGSSGTEGQNTTLTCITLVNSRETQIRWRGPMGPKNDTQRSNGQLLATSRTLRVSQVTNGLVCQTSRNGEQWTEACTLPPLTVLRENNIVIRPMLFSPNVDTLTITCKTRPPDRIEWFVFGDYGDIVDEHLSTLVLPGRKFNVNVTQKGGVSTLQMSGPSIPLYGIYTVMCTTGEGRYFRIAISQAQDSVSTVTTTTASTATVTCNEPRQEPFATFTVIVVSLTILELY